MLHATSKEGVKTRVVFSLKSIRKGPAASIYIDDCASADLGEWDHLNPAELADIPTISISDYGVFFLVSGVECGVLSCKPGADSVSEPTTRRSVTLITRRCGSDTARIVKKRYRHFLRHRSTKVPFFNEVPAIQ